MELTYTRESVRKGERRGRENKKSKRSRSVRGEERGDKRERVAALPAQSYSQTCLHKQRVQSSCIFNGPTVREEETHAIVSTHAHYRKLFFLSFSRHGLTSGGMWQEACGRRQVCIL